MQIHINHQTLFEDVYKHAPIGIALVSIEETYIKVNQALCKFFGYTEEELMGMTFRAITHPDHLKKDNNLFNELLDGGSTIYETEKRYIHKDGCTIWASIHISLVREEIDGAPLYFIVYVTDISEKKAALEKWLEVEHLFKLITENALDIISYNTPDGVTRYISPSVRDLLGYEPEEVIGKNNLHLYHPGDLEEMNSRSHADVDVLRYRLRHKNGNYIWFETTVKILRDNKGAIHKILGIGRDITERKRYEDTLAEAQRITQFGSWEWDILHNKITCSDQVYEIHGIAKDKLSAKPRDLLFLIHPEDRKKFLENMAQALKGSHFSSDYRQLHPDGTMKYLHIRASVTFDESGKPLKVNGTTQDITEKKKVELKLKESIERYTSLKKYNHDAVISFDLSGNIINCNVMAEQFTGYRVDQLIGVSLSKFIGDRNLQTILSGCDEHAVAEKNINKIKHLHGHHIEVLTTIAPIIINKETVGYYILAKDMTEHKKLLIAKEAAEKTNKAKSEFFAMMSHEIRTPMNGVIGMTDLLLETTMLDEQQKEYVEIIQKSGNTLVALINDILDFSKIEAGKAQLLEEPFSIRDTISEALDVLLSKALEKNLEMSVSVSPNVPVILMGDSNALRQVLINLIGNSVKFTNYGGVTIAVKGVMHSSSEVKLQFTVKDTGIGIAEDKRYRLFEPFYQVENFMTRKSKGTGLGLAISKRLVELMGGEIWVESGDGPGTTFVFTTCFTTTIDQIPLPKEPDTYDDEVEHTSLRILIAEDNEINQIVLKKMLENIGYRAKIVENGNKVIEAVENQTYDIIFMDIQMPEMSGLEALKVIKETMLPGKRPYIVAVTANALEGDREKYLEAGMDEYISKPIKSENIFKLINNFIKQQTTPYEVTP